MPVFHRVIPILSSRDSNGHYDVALAKKVWLRLTGDPLQYQLWYSADGRNFKCAGTGDTRYLSSETYGNFTGIMLGLWAQSPSGRGYADFEYFEYR